LKLLVAMFTAWVFLMSFAPKIVKADSETEAFMLDEVDTPPQVIKSYPPSYPKAARNKSVGGKVVLKFVVTTDGTAREIEAVAAEPEGIFEESAIEAVKKYKFNPGMKDGKPVDIIVKLPIVFELDTRPLIYDWIRTPHEWNPSDRYNLLFKRSQKQIENGKYEVAIDKLTTAIKIYNNRSPAFYLRGLGYRATGEYEKALSDFNRAIKLDSKEPVYYDERGVVYSLLENFPKAIKDFDKAIELNPDLNEAYFHRGDAFKQSGNYSDAIEDYTKGISMDDENLQAYINRGYCYGKLNHISNVCADFNKACELGDCQGYDALKESGICLDDVSEVLEKIQK